MLPAEAGWCKTEHINGKIKNGNIGVSLGSHDHFGDPTGSKRINRNRFAGNESSPPVVPFSCTLSVHRKLRCRGRLKTGTTRPKPIPIGCAMRERSDFRPVCDDDRPDSTRARRDG